MANRRRKLKIATIIALIASILTLHYFTIHSEMLRHAFYRILFYLPLVLGSFWFGLRGAVSVSAAVIICYFPFAVYRWGSPSYDFHILLEGGLYIFIAVVLGYLSEREKREQAARLEAERLAGIGRAVSEIAHDMKSPLMAIGGFASQVSRKLEPDEPNRKKLELVVRETARLESLVKEMLDFGRPLEMHTSMERLNSLADECVEVSRPIAGQKEVEIRTDFDAELPSQALDRDRIKQVIMNLITNALEASPPGKTVWICTRKENDEAVLELSDGGCGIREEDREKVFEPFFSTKKEGTGLGLPIVKKIVEAHGGSISLRSNPDGGVTFSVRLPAEGEL